jgi:hypothetical protein
MSPNSPQKAEPMRDIAATAVTIEQIDGANSAATWTS